MMILAIAGGTGSGKTTVANKMKSLYSSQSNIVIVSMDNYYKNINTEIFENYDHPNAFDIDLLHDDLSQYLSNGSIPVRSYDYVTKKSHITQTKSNITLLILEGLYPFYSKKIRDLCSKKIYLDIDEDTRLKRRVSRDLKERNISIEENTKMIHSFVKSMHKKHVTKQKSMADKIYTKIDETFLYL